MYINTPSTVNKCLDFNIVTGTGSSQDNCGTENTGLTNIQWNFEPSLSLNTAIQSLHLNLWIMILYTTKLSM